MIRVLINLILLGVCYFLGGLVVVVLGSIFGIGDGDSLFFWGGVFGAVAFVWWVVYNSSNEQQANEAARSAEIERQVSSDTAYRRWQRQSEFRSLNSSFGLVLQQDEELFFRECCVELYEATTQFAGHTTGMSAYIGEGLSVDSSDTTFSQQQTMSFKANGTLFITNKRIVFSSDMQSRSILLKDVATINASGRYWFIVCAHGLSVAQNFYCRNARVYSEGSKLLASNDT